MFVVCHKEFMVTIERAGMNISIESSDLYLFANKRFYASMIMAMREMTTDFALVLAVCL